MKKILHWLDENLEEFLLVFFLIAMTLIMGIQVFCRYVLGQSLSWSEEITRYLFIWSGFLSVSYCSKKCLSIKIEQFVAIFPRKGKAIFKLVNHTFELIFFLYMIPFAWSYLMSAVQSGLPDSNVLYTGSSACFLRTCRFPCPSTLDHRVSHRARRACHRSGSSGAQHTGILHRRKCGDWNRTCYRVRN